MTRLSLLLPLLALPLLAGCPDPTACTDLAAASARIHVYDEDGTTPLVATITATDSAGNAVEAVCDDADTGACTVWIVGYEIEGEITVTATAEDECGNTGTGSVTVDVPMDDEGCHVVMQEADLVVNDWTDLGCE